MAFIGLSAATQEFQRAALGDFRQVGAEGEKMDTVKLKIGAHVRVNFAALSPGNRQYWQERAGDGAGVVTGHNGRRWQVTFASGDAGMFEGDVLLAEDGQGELWG